MDSIFTKIISGEIPCYKIAENENYIAFLDINPLTIGHTLVVPKQQVDYLFDMEDDLYTGLMLFSKQVAKAIKMAIPCVKVGVVVIGLEVPHAHIHLLPINNVRDIDFSKPKLQLRKEDLLLTLEKISVAFKNILYCQIHIQKETYAPPH